MSTTLQLPALDPQSVTAVEQTGYPSPYNERVRGRARRALGNACGLTQFGVNLTTLAPGTHSAMRHWHTHEDEFVYIVSGELVLVTDAGEQVLRVGECAGFPAGKRDGHHLINRSNAPAQYLEIGSRNEADLVDYSDDDVTLINTIDGERYVHKDGSAYAK
jgi:uncharacterized cupin superfamily protein